MEHFPNHSEHFTGITSHTHTHTHTHITHHTHTHNDCQLHNTMTPAIVGGAVSELDIGARGHTGNYIGNGTGSSLNCLYNFSST